MPDQQMSEMVETMFKFFARNTTPNPNYIKNIEHLVQVNRDVKLMDGNYFNLKLR